MAIYSLRLAPIGKTTQKLPYTAAAHIRYITRKGAASLVMAERMPERTRDAIRWLRREERDDRANARVADKLVIALPRELTSNQRAELVRDFAERLTQGRASWFAAIHARGKDLLNPHCHLLIRDRDVVSGKRVVMFSAGAKEIAQRKTKALPQPTTLRMIRSLWAEMANTALARAGRSERIDHRTLIDQGDFRLAQVHEGPNVRAMHARGVKPVSRDRTVQHRGRPKKGARTVRYNDIDLGVSRVDYNASLKDAPPLSLTEIARAQSRSGKVRTGIEIDRGRGR